MVQFHQNEYLGDFNAANQGIIDVAVLEHGRVRNTHVGFKEDSGPSTRVSKLMECTQALGCVPSSYTSGYAEHATMVAGLAVGDLTDGQDPAIWGEYSRISRSGYAREASLHFYRAPQDADIVTALDGIAAGTAEILNMSIAGGRGNTTDPQCLGETAIALAVNNVFEHGIVPFVATGNNGHASTTDCVVEDAANAIGAFAVNMHTTDATGYADPIAQVRFGDINERADRGGTSVAEGKGRTIVDLTAAGCRTLLFDEFGGYAKTDCGTSLATPTVVGAAVEFMDHFRNVYSNLIFTPGILTANMLLMGDRTVGFDPVAGTSIKTTSGYHNVWGAGRMKMRRPDAMGMDQLYEYRTFWTCVSDGENYYFNLWNGNLLDCNIDVIKAVIFVYDRRHGVDHLTQVDNVDLFLEEYRWDPQQYRWRWMTVASSASTHDEKERIFHEPYCGRYRLRIRGTSVTADGEGCGENGIRVYGAVLLEDSARDDADGPDGTVDPE